MHHTLVEIGPSILNGGVTSIIGVVVFAALPSASLRAFCHLSVLTILFGLFQGALGFAMQQKCGRSGG